MFVKIEMSKLSELETRRVQDHVMMHLPGFEPIVLGLPGGSVSVVITAVNRGLTLEGGTSVEISGYTI